MAGGCTDALAGWDQPTGSPVAGSALGRTEAPALIDFGGRAYVAWSERNGDAWKLLVDRLTAGGWQQVGRALNHNMSEKAIRPAVAVANGKLYVAWEELGDNDWHIWVSAFDGSTWQPVGGDLNPTRGMQAAQPRTAVIDGLLYVAFQATAVFDTPEIQVDRFDGSQWQQVGFYLNRNTTDPAHWANLADVNGVPFVAWEETYGGTSHVLVDRLEGSDWVPVGTEVREPNTGAAYQPSIAGVGGAPYVVWEENEYGSAMWHTWVASFDGTSWLSPAELHAPHAPNALGPDITTVNGAPYVVWEEYGAGSWHIRVATLHDQGWQLVSSALNSGASTHSIRPSIAEVDGYPFAAWNEYSGPQLQVHTGRLVPDFATTITPAGGAATLTSLVQPYAFSYEVGFQYGPGTTMVHATAPIRLARAPISLRARLAHMRAGGTYSYRPYIRMGTDQPLAYGKTHTYRLRRPSAPYLAILSRTVRVDRRGVAKIKVRCPLHGPGCGGHLTLVGPMSARGGHGKSRTTMLGRRAFKVRPGRRLTIALRLSKPALRMVRSRHTASALVTAVDSVKGPAARRRATSRRKIRVRA